MNEIKQLRMLIDKLDDQIIKSLEKRFEIVESIKEFKKMNKIEVKDTNREEEILKKCNSQQTKEVFMKIMEESRKQQTG